VKIGYVFGGRFDPVALGGNATDIREDLDGMGELGHDVAFRSHEVGPQGIPEAVRAAKTRIPAPVWDTVRDAALLRRDGAWRRRLLRDESLRHSELAFEYWYPDSFGGHALASRLRIPHVLENIDPITDDARAGERGGTLNRLIRRYERERREAAAAIVVMSDPMKEYLVDSGLDPARLHVLPQGVNTRLFAPPTPDRRAEVRADLQADGRFIVGFVGSMATYQRVDVLVEAARRLRCIRSDLRVVLVGGTEGRARALGITDEANVISNVPYEQIPDLIGAFDVAVLPDSNWYGSPVKVLEYGAVGVPIVAPDVGPVRDLINAPAEGLLVPTGDPDALADAISATVDDPAGAAARAARFRQKVLDRFDRKERTQRLLELCRRLVDEGC